VFTVRLVDGPEEEVSESPVTVILVAFSGELSVFVQSGLQGTVWGVVWNTVYVNWSAGVTVDCPTGVVTVTSTTPATPTGEVAVIESSLTTMTFLAVVPLKSTSVAPVKPDPVMVRGVPPVVNPVEGSTSLTMGSTAGVIVVDAVADFVSEEVDTDAVTGPVVVGLVTPLRETETTSPALMEYPPEIAHETVVPLVTVQREPTVWSVVLSRTSPPVNDPMLVPVGRVTVMVLPAVPSRSPEDEVVNPIVQVVMAPATEYEGVTDRDLTDCADVREAEAVTDLVSELVTTLVVVDPVVVGFVTPAMDTVTASPAGTEYPL
jgi:hypothetical protein